MDSDGDRPMTDLFGHYGTLDSIGSERLYPANRNAMAAYPWNTTVMP